LGNDYFNFDKARHEMAGERTGVRYRLGDRLRVKVSRVDLETTRIDFVLAEFGGRRESIPDELSILPDRYRAKAKSEKAKSEKAKSEKGKPEKQGAKQRDLKASHWGVERKSKTAHAKKSGAVKSRKSGAKKPSPKRSK
jgi:ribonuclease R